jgi:WS/DGAT/MGAT family acyltransferase
MTARNLLLAPTAWARFGAAALRAALGALPELRDPKAPPLPIAIPRVSFNAEVGPERAFACASVPLESVKEVKKHLDVTVNDVVLAVTGGALRRYLARRRELPRRPLVALVAVSTRSEGNASLGNQVTMAPVDWATDARDPVARVRRIHAGAKRAIERARAAGPDLVSALGLFPPALVSPFVAGAGARFALALNPGTAIVSNVRGTPVPLYTAGARIETMYPLSVLATGQGLNFTAVSYRGRVDFGLTVDPRLVPEPWSLADAIPAALEELRQAALRRARPARPRRAPAPSEA